MKYARLMFQIAFLGLVGVAVFVLQGNCEVWCPFGGVELLTTYLPQRSLTCSLSSSNLYTMVALVGLTLLVRRAFCSWLCPLGSLAEWSGLLGARLLGPLRRPPPWLDRCLSPLKYAVLAIILILTYRAGELVFRGFDPCYALISRHGHMITVWAYVVLGALLLGSLVLSLPFCRWLCPLAAVLNIPSRLGLLSPVRDPVGCTSCGQCDRVCGMAIDVSNGKAVRAARCTSCMECIDVCPQPGVIAYGTRRARRLWLLVPVLIVALTLLAIFASRAYPLPTLVFERGTPSAELDQETFMVAGLRCRGTSMTFCELLVNRLDEYALQGYVEVVCFASPDAGRAVVSFERGRTDRQGIIDAFTEPVLDLTELRLDELLEGSGEGGDNQGRPTGFEDVAAE